MAEVSVADEWGVVKRGYIDRTGKLVIPARYDKTFPVLLQSDYTLAHWQRHG